MEFKRSATTWIASLTGAFLLTAAATTPVGAQAPGDGQPQVALPLDLVDSVDQAKFKIRVPANWNGTLLIFAAGTLGVPRPLEPRLVPPVLPSSEPPLEQTLLSRGYALAASGVATTDWQMKEEVQDTLTLAAYFRGRVGVPKRVIIWGTSLGGLVSLRLIEEFPRAFDGAIATCGGLAGWSRRWDRLLDFSLAYAVAFGWPVEAWGPVEDLRDDLNFARDVSPRVQWPGADGSNRGGWEFIRLVSGVTSEAFWATDPGLGITGFAAHMLFATEMRSGAEAWAAGPVAQNAGRQYTLKPEEKTYLAGLGVNSEDLLAKMNSRANIPASPLSRDYMRRFGDVRGKLIRPVITLHSTQDGVADVSHESAYRAAVQSWNCSENLVQTYVSAVGHCAFTPKHLLAALTAMEHWLDSGKAPDASFFLEAQGFDNRFVPPDWPN